MNVGWDLDDVIGVDLDQPCAVVVSVVCVWIVWRVNWARRSSHPATASWNHWKKKRSPDLFHKLPPPAIENVAHVKFLMFYFLQGSFLNQRNVTISQPYLMFVKPSFVCGILNIDAFKENWVSLSFTGWVCLVGGQESLSPDGSVADEPDEQVVAQRRDRDVVAPALAKPWE